MKKIILLFIVLSSFPSFAQSNNLLLFGGLGSMEFNDQYVYEQYNKKYGLDKKIYSVGLMFKRDINFLPFVNQVGLTFQYFPKNYYKENIPVTTVDFPDGNGQYEEHTFDINVYTLGFIFLHKYQFDERISILVGPTIGYGIYANKIAFGSTEDTENYDGVYYNFSANLEVKFFKNYFISVSTCYEYFNPDVTSYNASTGATHTFQMDKIDGLKGKIGMGIYF